MGGTSAPTASSLLPFQIFRQEEDEIQVVDMEQEEEERQESEPRQRKGIRAPLRDLPVAQKQQQQQQQHKTVIAVNSSSSSSSSSTASLAEAALKLPSIVLPADAAKGEEEDDSQV